MTAVGLAPHDCRAGAARAAFTLIEVMAVILLTSLVLGVALDYYYDLSRASQRASDRTREVRRATAILDRVAADLEGAAIVQKSAEEDRLSHPWVFLGEDRGVAEKGSDRIKFITRNRTPRRRSVSRHESDTAVVTYSAERNGDERISLRRWSSAGLPEGLDRNFPDPDDALLISDDLGSFSFQFLDETGSWVDLWDSSQIVQADELPVAVRIELALANTGMDEAPVGDDLEGGEARRFQRTVVLPVRPLDLEILTDPKGLYGSGEGAGGQGEEGNDEDDPTNAANASKPCATNGLSWADCVNVGALLESGGSFRPWMESRECFKPGVLPPEYTQAQCL